MGAWSNAGDQGFQLGQAPFCLVLTLFYNFRKLFIVAIGIFFEVRFQQDGCQLPAFLDILFHLQTDGLVYYIYKSPELVQGQKRGSGVHRNYDVCPHGLYDIDGQIIHQSSVHQKHAVFFQRSKKQRNRHRCAESFRHGTFSEDIGFAVNQVRRDSPEWDRELVKVILRLQQAGR